ncbi:MAG: 2-C-methyl-D-erythritol 4-phosphate cytidylyltransferase [Clostridia bacterium]|nr:2-C-methyl-D-erythritol 4-phosphate cytidylyltransferase [Clostridia bacterium]
MKKKNKPVFVSAVIAAGGTSSRMNGDNKLLLEIGGIPVIAHSLLAFQSCDSISEIIISAHESHLQTYADIAQYYDITKLTKVVKGGDTRLQSVYNAVKECSKKADYILVHDAARPLITDEDIKTVIGDTISHNCAAASNKVTDTVKKVSDRLAQSTVDRTDLYTVQTPQGADRDLLYGALEKAVGMSDGSVTDECSALEKIGIKPYMSDCSVCNIKITYPQDVFIANAIYDRRNKK